MDFEKAKEIVNQGGAVARPAWKGEVMLAITHLRKKDDGTEYLPADQGFLRRFYPKNHVKYPAGADLFFDQDDYKADVAASDWEDVTDDVMGKDLAKIAVAPATPEAEG